MQRLGVGGVRLLCSCGAGGRHVQQHVHVRATSGVSLLVCTRGRCLLLRRWGGWWGGLRSAWWGGLRSAWHLWAWVLMTGWHVVRAVRARLLYLVLRWGVTRARGHV